MNDRPKNSRVGLGQKPRGKHASVPQPRTPTPAPVESKGPSGDETPAEVSANAVQPEGANEPVSAVESAPETPHVPEENIVQNLESAPEAENGIVAADDPLDDLLEKSKDEVPINTATDDLKTNQYEIEHGPHGAIGVFSPGADHDDLADAAAIAGLHAGDFDSVFGKRPTIRELGEQPDGTFKMAITIPEGMIEPIRQQAEADGITPEAWVSYRLLEYCESWWQPAQNR